MKNRTSAYLLLPALLGCGVANAQFRQPPPDRPAPTCDRQKEGGAGLIVGSDCKAYVLAPNNYTSLHCEPDGPELYCDTSTWSIYNGQWIYLSPSTLTHDWAYIVDGREYYLGPTSSDTIVIGCGVSKHGYVRITAGWSTKINEFRCP